MCLEARFTLQPSTAPLTPLGAPLGERQVSTCPKGTKRKEPIRIANNGRHHREYETIHRLALVFNVNDSISGSD